jgi:hypothetical protein
MNYRIKLENAGFKIKESYVKTNIGSISNVTYSISKNGKAASFKTLKEAYSFIDFWK